MDNTQSHPRTKRRVRYISSLPRRSSLTFQSSERSIFRRPLLLAALVIAAASMVLAGVFIGMARDQPPGDDSVDAGFARDMSVHHGQAVQMAITAHDRTDNPAIKTLALDIMLTQHGQVGIMQGWLDAWNLPSVSANPPMSWMGSDMDDAMNAMPSMDTMSDVPMSASMDMTNATPTSASMGSMDGMPTSASMDMTDATPTAESMDSMNAMPTAQPTEVSAANPGSVIGNRMPGWATQEEINSLATLPVNEMNKEFLRLMIRHHQGGVLMAKAAVDRADTPQIKDLARSIIITQQSEITQMEQLLAEISG